MFFNQIVVATVTYQTVPRAHLPGFIIILVLRIPVATFLVLLVALVVMVRIVIAMRSVKTVMFVMKLVIVNPKVIFMNAATL
jgi:hypothetical protein